VLIIYLDQIEAGQGSPFGVAPSADEVMIETELVYITGDLAL